MPGLDLRAALVPELDVADVHVSLGFYVGVLGFQVVFERRAERFAYLALDGAELMLQEAEGPGRRFRTAPLERPFRAAGRRPPAAGCCPPPAPT